MSTHDERESRPDDSTEDATPSASGNAARSPRVVSSESLLAGAAQLAIVHNRTVYYLRQTRLGKLILTK
jgi:hemin uptake protein HemP